MGPLRSVVPWGLCSYKQINAFINGSRLIITGMGSGENKWVRHMFLSAIYAFLLSYPVVTNTKGLCQMLVHGLPFLVSRTVSQNSVVSKLSTLAFCHSSQEWTNSFAFTSTQHSAFQWPADKTSSPSKTQSKEFTDDWANCAAHNKWRKSKHVPIDLSRYRRRVVHSSNAVTLCQCPHLPLQASPEFFSTQPCGPGVWF